MAKISRGRKRKSNVAGELRQYGSLSPNVKNMTRQESPVKAGRVAKHRSRVKSSDNSQSKNNDINWQPAATVLQHLKSPFSPGPAARTRSSMYAKRRATMQPNSPALTKLREKLVPTDVIISPKKSLRRHSVAVGRKLRTSSMAAPQQIPTIDEFAVPLALSQKTTRLSRRSSNRRSVVPTSTSMLNDGDVLQESEAVTDAVDKLDANSSCMITLTQRTSLSPNRLGRNDIKAVVSPKVSKHRLVDASVSSTVRTVQSVSVTSLRERRQGLRYSLHQDLPKPKRSSDMKLTAARKSRKKDKQRRNTQVKVKAAASVRKSESRDLTPQKKKDISVVKKSKGRKSVVKVNSQPRRTPTSTAQHHLSQKLANAGHVKTSKKNDLSLQPKIPKEVYRSESPRKTATPHSCLSPRSQQRLKEMRSPSLPVRSASASLNSPNKPAERSSANLGKRIDTPRCHKKQASEKSIPISMSSDNLSTKTGRKFDTPGSYKKCADKQLNPRSSSYASSALLNSNSKSLETNNLSRKTATHRRHEKQSSEMSKLYSPTKTGKTLQLKEKEGRKVNQLTVPFNKNLKPMHKRGRRSNETSHSLPSTPRAGLRNKKTPKSSTSFTGAVSKPGGATTGSKARKYDKLFVGRLRAKEAACSPTDSYSRISARSSKPLHDMLALNVTPVVVLESRLSLERYSKALGSQSMKPKQASTSDKNDTAATAIQMHKRMKGSVSASDVFANKLARPPVRATCSASDLRKNEVSLPLFRSDQQGEPGPSTEKFSRKPHYGRVATIRPQVLHTGKNEYTDEQPYTSTPKLSKKILEEMRSFHSPLPNPFGHASRGCQLVADTCISSEAIVSSYGQTEREEDFETDSNSALKRKLKIDSETPNASLIKRTKRDLESHSSSLNPEKLLVDRKFDDDGQNISLALSERDLRIPGSPFICRTGETSSQSASTGDSALEYQSVLDATRDYQLDAPVSRCVIL